jgi:hypothetical protein
MSEEKSNNWVDIYFDYQSKPDRKHSASLKAEIIKKKYKNLIASNFKKNKIKESYFDDPVELAK